MSLQLLICRKCVVFWFDLSVFSYWTRWMLKANIQVESLNILYYLIVRLPKIRIQTEQKKNIEDKIVGDHLKLYFYYIKQEQNSVVMYLELIFTGIKTERWKVAEVSKIAHLGHLVLKQEWKIVQGLTGVRKMVYAGFEAWRMRELKYKSYRGKIVYLGIEAGKKYCLCRDWNQ